MALIVELSYAPPIPWFVLARKTDTLVLEQYEHYQKGSYRNRCHIAGPQQMQRLTLPLEKGKHQRTPIREVRLSYDQAWPHQHWQALQSAYGRSPFFEHYAPSLAPIFHPSTATLWEFNIQLLHWIYQQLDWTSNWQLTSAYGEWKKPVIDGREWVHPKRKLPAFLDWQPIPYWQVFQDTVGFLPNLSILDLLFNCGPEAVLLLEQSVAQCPSLTPLQR